MHVFIAPPDSLVYKTVPDKEVGVDQVPSINDNRVWLSGQGPYMARNQILVLVMPGKDHYGICSPYRFIQVMEDRNAGIFHHIRIMDTHRRTGSDEVIPVGFCGGVPVSYTHLRAHETDSYLVCRLLLEKKK